MQDSGAPGQENAERAGSQDGLEEKTTLGSRRADPFAERARYAYLFRMWAEPRRRGKPPLWRFGLEEVESGVRHGFGSMEALVEFLQERMATE